MPLRAQKYGLHPKLNQNWCFNRLLMLTGSRAGKGTQEALRVQVLEETGQGSKEQLLRLYALISQWWSGD